MGCSKSSAQREMYSSKCNVDEMGQILEKNKLSQVTQYEIDHLNRLITIKEIEFVI